MNDSLGEKSNRTRHRFFLSPYEDMAFTKCPKCDCKTKQRKLPLVIHIEPEQVLALNKTCRYCPNCDLVIAREKELEAMMAATFEDQRPEIIGNEYLVVGTLDRTDWREGSKSQLPPDQVLDRVYIFEDEWYFEIEPSGWYLPHEK
ncbi:MAG: hypothetical protein ACYTF1_09495 [Planctomycetota bacterium]